VPRRASVALPLAIAAALALSSPSLSAGDSFAPSFSPWLTYGVSLTLTFTFTFTTVVPVTIVAPLALVPPRVWVPVWCLAVVKAPVLSAARGAAIPLTHIALALAVSLLEVLTAAATVSVSLFFNPSTVVVFAARALAGPVSSGGAAPFAILLIVTLRAASRAAALVVDMGVVGVVVWSAVVAGRVIAAAVSVMVLFLFLLFLALFLLVLVLWWLRECERGRFEFQPCDSKNRNQQRGAE
jgi:hypothetical protein